MVSATNVRAELSAIVAENELTDEVRIPLEKLLISVVKESRNAQDNLAVAQAEAKAAARSCQVAKATADQLALDNESLRQRLQGKEANIARLEGRVTILTTDLNARMSKGYNAPMIRDFLDQLRLDIAGSAFESEHGGAFETEGVDEVVKYARRYGQWGGFTPMRVGTEPVDLSGPEIAAQRKEELAHLEALWPRLQFALEAAARPSETFVIVSGNADGGGWMPMKELMTARRRES